MTENLNPNTNASISNRGWKDFIPLSILIAGILIAGSLIYINRGNLGGPAAINPGSSPTPTVSSTPQYKNLDTFAKCLTEKGVKFYGASWCGHCANQKAMFGEEAMKYVTYIECWDSTANKLNNTCTAAKIEGFPTWDFPGGERQMGEMPLENLSELSGCPLTKIAP